MEGTSFDVLSFIFMSLAPKLSSNLIYTEEVNNMSILKDVSTVDVTMKGEREMEWRTLNLYQEDNLLIDEEAVIFAAKAAKYGNVYGVYGAGLASLPTLNDITIADSDSVADVEKKLNERLYDLDLNGYRCGEALDIPEDVDVVYCPLRKEFLLASEMNFYPVYLFLDKDKDDFDCVWLKEPQHTMDVSCEAGIILSDEFGHIGIYEIYQLDGKPVYDKCLLRYISQENQPAGLIMSSRELRKLLNNTK